LSGAEVWNFPTGSHVESSPRLVGGSVFCAAGEDGIYCLDAATSKPRWRFAGLHIDTTPAVADGRVFAGSVYGKPETVCLAADTGKPLWRKPSELSVLVPPATAPGRVYFGLGNGKLNRIDPNPAGALVCLDAISGDILWRRDLPDAVIGAPVVHDDLICFGCRDHHCYCLDRADGGLRWKTDLGSPVAAAPTIAGPHVYAVGARGQLCCLDIQTGAVTWRFNIARHSGAAPEILGAPSFAADQVYVGAGLDNSITSAAVVYCVKSPRP
jgi:outer membrane protein assembly factor BamB